MSEAVRAACVIGRPVAHSRSPLIHGYWIGEHKLAADYRREALEPDAVADFLANLAGRGYVGCNVTLPHKEAALAASEPDDRARAVGAANTLWLDKDRLLSTNTDVEGFTNNLDAMVPDWDRRSGEAVVLGAGGSARAVIYGLLERGFARIHVVNRTFDRAQALRDRFGESVQPANWSALPHLLARAGLLVNTTQLGMTGQARLEIDLAPLPQEAVVADLVYAPLETELLAIARARPRDSGWARHAAASSGSRLFAVVRRSPRGNGGTARPDRGRS